MSKLPIFWKYHNINKIYYNSDGTKINNNLNHYGGFYNIYGECLFERWN